MDPGRRREGLAALKITLFLVYGGFSCLWPFLAVHARHLGLTIEEIAIISFVVPLMGLLGPSLAGFLGRKPSHTKPALVVCLTISAVAFTCLLIVPSVVRHRTRTPRIAFECSLNDGGKIYVERCENECFSPLINPAVLGIRDCKYECDHSPSSFALNGSLPPDLNGGIGGGSTSDIKPDLHPMNHLSNDAEFPTAAFSLYKSELPKDQYICVQNQPVQDKNGTQLRGRMCHIFNVSGIGAPIPLVTSILRTQRLEFPNGGLLRKPGEKVTPVGTSLGISDQCVSPLTFITDNGTESSYVTCRLPHAPCRIVCDGFLYDDPNDSPSQLISRPKYLSSGVNNIPSVSFPDCQDVEGHPLMTYGLYFLFRVIAEFFLFASIALLDGSILSAAACQHPVGLQLAFGMIGIALFPPLAGILIDRFAVNHNSLLPIEYTPAFLACDFLTLVACVTIASCKSLKLKAYSNNVAAFASRMVRSSKIVTFFIAMFILGMLFGFTETFLYPTLHAQGGSSMLLGLLFLAGFIPSLPLVAFGDRLASYLRTPNLLIAAMFAYFVRLSALSYITFDSREFNLSEVAKEDIPVPVSPLWALVWQPVHLLSGPVMWVGVFVYSIELAGVANTALRPAIALTAVLLHNNIGRAAGTLLGGYIHHFLGAVAAFRGAALFAGFSGLIYMAVHHFYVKDREPPVYMGAEPNGGCWRQLETIDSGTVAYSNGSVSLSERPMLQGKGRF